MVVLLRYVILRRRDVPVWGPTDYYTDPDTDSCV